MQMKKLFSQVLVTATAFLLVGQVSAAGVSVTPVNNYIVVGGGEEQVLTYTFKNQGPDEVWLDLEVESFASDGESGQPVLLGETEFPYVSLVTEASDESKIFLPGGSEKEVQVKVTPPLGVAEKEFPLTLFFVVGENNLSEEQTELNLRLGANLIVLTDKSNEDKSSLRAELINGQAFVDTLVPNSVQVKADNDGPMGTLIAGELVLRRRSGEEVTRWHFYSDLVLGESSRLIRGTTQDLETTRHPLLSTDFTLPRGLLGEYELEARLRSHHPLAQDDIYVTTVRFWALPYRALAVVALVVVLIVLLSYFSKRRKSQRQFQQRVSKMQRQKQYFS